MRFNWLRWTLLLPLVLAFIAQLLGISVSGRDDEAYIRELSESSFFTLAPDQMSWLLLRVCAALFNDPVLGLRFAGLLVALLTTYAVARERAGPDALSYFVVSILPLFFVIYFNQIRFGVAILIYLFLLTTRRFARVAPLGAVLGHASGILFAFPPIVLLIPLALGFFAVLDPSSPFLFRLLVYANVEQLLMPWYFGWELVALALVYLSLRNPIAAVQLAAVTVASRLIGDTMSVDIARRILELSLFAYSPICLYLKTGEPVSTRLIVF
jgi:hypothetical protein